MYLLDTNIVSELRKTKPHGAVLAWFQTLDEDEVAIPAIVIGEIQAGVEITRRQDPEKANEIEAWLDKGSRHVHRRSDGRSVVSRMEPVNERQIGRVDRRCHDCRNRPDTSQGFCRI